MSLYSAETHLFRVYVCVCVWGGGGGGGGGWGWKRAPARQMSVRANIPQYKTNKD